MVRFELTLGGQHYSQILTLPMGRLHVKHAVQRGILGVNSAFAPGSRKITENLNRIGRSQDLSDAN
jgi:hypothetical protein